MKKGRGFEPGLFPLQPAPSVPQRILEPHFHAPATLGRNRTRAPVNLVPTVHLAGKMTQ